jgi:hypothetical protein
MKAIFLALLLITSSVQAYEVDILNLYDAILYDDPLAYPHIADPVMSQYKGDKHAFCNPDSYEKVQTNSQVPGPSPVTLIIFAMLVLTLISMRLKSRLKAGPINKKIRRGVRPYHRVYCHRN